MPPSEFPEAPENVRIVHADGTTTALQTVYVGYDEDEQMHVWHTIPGTRPIGPGDHVTIDTMPARTAIVLPSDLE